jgi:hypothetical protein
MRKMLAMKNETQHIQIKILCKSPGFDAKYLRFIVVPQKGRYAK